MKLEKILDLNDEVEAALLGSVLAERGIPHVIRSLHDTAYDGLVQAQAGCWGWVEAPAEEREKIEQIHADIAHSRGLAAPDESEPEADAGEWEPSAEEKRKNGRFFIVLTAILLALLATGVLAAVVTIAFR